MLTHVHVHPDAEAHTHARAHTHTHTHMHARAHNIVSPNGTHSIMETHTCTHLASSWHAAVWPSCTCPHAAPHACPWTQAHQQFLERQAKELEERQLQLLMSGANANGAAYTCKHAWSSFRAHCFRLIVAPQFNLFNAAIIFLNAIVLGLNWYVCRHHPHGRDHKALPAPSHAPVSPFVMPTRLRLLFLAPLDKPHAPAQLCRWHSMFARSSSRTAQPQHVLAGASLPCARTHLCPHAQLSTAVVAHVPADVTRRYLMPPKMELAMYIINYA